jgi:hypothetical protein
VRDERVAMKKFSLILSLIGAIVASGNAFAVTMPSTLCPASFTCAFDAAEVRPLSDQSSPGAPAVYVGYLSFDSLQVPTLHVLGNTNGTTQTLLTAVGTCTAGTSSALGVLNFETNGPKFDFVSNAAGTELRLIITADGNNVTPSSVNLGTCTQQ